MADLLAKNPNVKTAAASWPKGEAKRKASSTAEKLGTQASSLNSIHRLTPRTHL